MRFFLKNEFKLILTLGAVTLFCLSTACTEQIYWTDRFNGTVNVSNTTTHTTTQLVSIAGLNPWGIAIDGLTNKLFFTSGNNEGDFNAAIYSVRTNRQVKWTPFFGPPGAIS